MFNRYGILEGGNILGKVYGLVIVLFRKVDRFFRLVIYCGVVDVDCDVVGNVRFCRVWGIVESSCGNVDCRLLLVVVVVVCVMVEDWVFN